MVYLLFADIRGTAVGRTAVKHPLCLQFSYSGLPDIGKTPLITQSVCEEREAVCVCDA